MNNELNQQISYTVDVKSTLQLDIVSAERSIFSGRAKMVIVTGDQGEIGILPGHTQLLAALKPGQIRYVTPEGKEEFLYVSGGFVEVQPDIVTVLADTILRAVEIDEERAIEAKEKAEKILASKGHKVDDYTAALIELSKALAQLRVKRRRGGK